MGTTRTVGGIREYPCRYGAEQELTPELCAAAGVSLPGAHVDATAMVALSRCVAEASGTPFCLLPFCHTVEAEALGASINLGDERFGPRAAEYACAGLEELLALLCSSSASSSVDEASSEDGGSGSGSSAVGFTCGRAGAVLDACQLLAESQEEPRIPVLQVSGPLTILNSLVDSAVVLKGIRKQSDLAWEAFDLLAGHLLAFIRAAYGRGVRIVSYSDPTGGVDIVGPRVAKQIAERFTVPFLSRIQAEFGDELLVVLCPKTAFVLVDLGFAEEELVPLPQPMTYGEAMAGLAGRASLLGGTCIKEASTRRLDEAAVTLRLRP